MCIKNDNLFDVSVLHDTLCLVDNLTKCISLGILSGMENQDLVRSKSSEFFERYGRAEDTNVKLNLALLIVGGVAIILVFAVIFVASRPRPIHYIPGAISAGVSYPNQIPKSSVVSFATSWLMNWSNFTPETVESVYARSIIYMAPGLLSRTRAKLSSEIQKVHSDRISSIYTLKQDPTVSENNRGFDVFFTGKRGVYMGKEQLSIQDVQYFISIDRVPPTEANPYGLVVNDLKQEILSETKQ